MKRSPSGALMITHVEDEAESEDGGGGGPDSAAEVDDYDQEETIALR